VNGRELAEHAGITYRQADYWSRAGWLRPLNPGCGNGHQRDYSPTEAVVAARMGRLVRAGLEPAVAAAVVRGDARAIATLESALESALRWSA